MQEEAGSARDAKRQCIMRQTLSVHTAYCVYCPFLRHEGGDNKSAALSNMVLYKVQEALEFENLKIQKQRILK
jgi:hypothetical protein